MARRRPDDDDEQDTGILLEDEVSGAVRAARLDGLERGSPSRDAAARWMEESLQNSSTVLRRPEGPDTKRVPFDELPRPRGPRSRPATGPGRRVAGGTPTRARVPSVAEVVHEPSFEPSVEESTGGSRDLRPAPDDPAWMAVQASLAGLLVSAALGLVVLVGFVLIR